MQSSFLPIKLAKLEPYTGTADLKVVGYTSTSEKFAVKREQDGDLLPLSEWIGYSICQLCDIPTPFYSVVECPFTNELAFGSRWEENSYQITKEMENVDKLDVLSKHKIQISEIHAIDRFTSNRDRHAGNYLFTIRANFEICLSIDFSKAIMRVSAPFGLDYLDSNSNTMRLKMILDDKNFFQKRYYKLILKKIKEIKDNDFINILDKAPDDWFKNLGKIEIIDWWTSNKLNRIACIDE